ncbi:MAG TPA: hypothetical protein VJL89_01920, partial [Thermodesulfovibrionia bacterium]|nr:hypothetical protein [Thermodesulfovibrionia bacterium]
MNNHAGTPVVIKADSLLTDKGIITDNFTLKVLNGRFQEIGKSAGYDNELAAMDLTGFTICPTFCDYHLHFSKKSIDDPESI